MKKSTTLKRRLLTAMVVVIIAQALVYIIVVQATGAINGLKESRYDAVESTVYTKKESVENKLIRYKTMLDTFAKNTNESFISISQTNNINLTSELTYEQSSLLLNEQIESFISQIKSNSLNGLFVLFDNQESSVKDGLYLRTLASENDKISNADILGEYGGPSLIKEHGVTLDSLWTSKYNLDEATNQNFYQKVKETTLENPSLSMENLGYWSSEYKIRSVDIDLCSYSVPLRDQNGNFYGVMGVMLSTNTMANYLPYRDLGCGEKAGFILADSSDGKKFNIGFMQSSYLSTIYKVGDKFEIDSDDYCSVTDGEPLVTNNIKLDIYPENGPYNQNEIYLVALTNSNTLFSDASSLQHSIFVALTVSVVFAYVCIIFISSRITNSLNKLTNSLLKQDPSKQIHLDSLGIKEIDTLSNSIETLSRNVAYASGRVDEIFKISNILIGAVDFGDDERTVYCSDNLRELLNISDNYDLTSYGDVNKLYNEILNKIEKREDVDEHRYRALVNKHWYEITTSLYHNHRIITISDVTKEVEENQKIKFERDYDSLTGLLNRRSFLDQAQVILNKYTGEIACILLDLDNLKYVNDIYGHDVGDIYIQTTANYIKELPKNHVLTSRRSGDEFMLLLYGYNSKKEILKQIYNFHQKLTEQTIELGENHIIKLRGSAGIAWYRVDADDLKTLIRHADFAMYDAKRSQKGTIISFNEDVYERDKMLVNGVELLNTLLETTAVKYAFQPIVDVHTGEIHAYEALMRSTLPQLKSPSEVMRLAKSQSKLYYIEQMTWVRALSDFSALNTNVKLFINSIPNVNISQVDIYYLEDRYKDYLHNIVVEMIETEQIHELSFKFKSQFINRWNCKLAIDDFGTGYSNEENLIDMKPDYVKIDMSLITDINLNSDKQDLVTNLINYAKDRNILVIAEGVETEEEFKCVVELGVDFVQGFFLYKPSFELANQEEIRTKVLSLKNKV